MKFFLSILLFCINIIGFSQDRLEQFFSFYHPQHVAHLGGILEEWETKEGQTGDWFLAKYWHMKLLYAENDFRLVNTHNEPADYYLIDGKSDTPIDLQEFVVYPDWGKTKMAEVFEGAFVRHPSRLDLRLAEIEFYKEQGLWLEMVKSVERLLDRSAAEGHFWVVRADQTVSDGEKTILKWLDDLQIELYTSGDDILLPYMRTIALKTIEVFPRWVQAYNDVAVTYLHAGDFEQSIVYLRQAHKIAPNDLHVVGNLAYLLKLNGQKEEALIYYRKMMESGDAETANFAKEQHRKLASE